MTPERFREIDFALGRSYSDCQWRLLDLWLGHIDRDGVNETDGLLMLVDSLSPAQLLLFRIWLRALHALVRARINDNVNPGEDTDDE